jgi:hypothetical protein
MTPIPIPEPDTEPTAMIVERKICISPMDEPTDFPDPPPIPDPPTPVDELTDSIVESKISIPSIVEVPASHVPLPIPDPVKILEVAVPNDSAVAVTCD